MVMNQSVGDPDLLIAVEVLQALLSAIDQGFEHRLIVDLCPPQMYAAAHIPGALHLPVDQLNRGEKPDLGQLPSLERLQSLVEQLGITPETHVICYDDEGGGWAGRLIWILDVIGHTRKSYLNGGIRAWLAAGYDIESKPNIPIPCRRQIEINDAFFVDKANVLAQLNNPDRVIWDARSPEEFSGERMFAQRAGHIPGAVNYEWTLGMDFDQAFKIRPLEKIRAELTALGISDDKEVITHCQTHHRSGFTYFLGRLLGFKNIRAYPGSWSEWGNAADTPVESL